MPTTTDYPPGCVRLRSTRVRRTRAGVPPPSDTVSLGGGGALATCARIAWALAW